MVQMALSSTTDLDAIRRQMRQDVEQHSWEGATAYRDGYTQRPSRVGRRELPANRTVQ